MNNDRLTKAQEEAVLKDFEEWSGGFTPAQCSSEDHKSYAAYARDISLDEGAVYRFISGKQ